MKEKEGGLETKNEEYLKAILPEVIRRCSDDFELFYRALVIPSATGPQLFDNCIEDFQVKAFRKLRPSLEAIRDNTDPPIRRFWIERTKKASKDADVSIMVLWLIAFARRPLKIQVCAANHKQASIIKNRAIELLWYNPWLNQFVEIIESAIRNRRMFRQVWAHIEATDSKGAAHGEAPDLLVLNELVHVAKWRAMEDHLHNADGTARSVVIVATNAGIKGTKAWQWRENAIRSKKRWQCLFWSTPAPWARKEDVEDARRRDVGGAEFERLWLGRWISGVGNALTEDEVEGCFVRDGELAGPERGWVYLLGLDLGVSKDHAGVAVVGVHKEKQIIRVARIRGFRPSIQNAEKNLEVDSDSVEKYVEETWQTFRFVYGGYDPAAGGSFMAQRLRKKGISMSERKFGSATEQTQMATCFVQAAKARKLECYDDDEGRLRRDFGKFSIEHKLPRGYKLVAVADEFGHADVGIALVITLPKAFEILGWPVGLSKDDVITDLNDDELNEDELEELPDEFKELNDLFEEEAVGTRLRSIYGE